MTDSSTAKPIRRSPFATAAGEGRAIWFLDTLTQVKAPAAATGGALSVVEQVLPAGSSPPLHVHRREDEAWYVVEGNLTYRLGEHTVTAEAGAFVWAPRDIAHTFRVDSPTARILVITVPGGFDEFFAAAGTPAPRLTLPPPPEGPPDTAALIAHALDYGCEILGPPLD